MKIQNRFLVTEDDMEYMRRVARIRLLSKTFKLRETFFSNHGIYLFLKVKRQSFKKNAKPSCLWRDFESCICQDKNSAVALITSKISHFKESL